MGINLRKPNYLARTALSNDGFTLLELLIVMGIIGVLAFTSIFSVKEFINRTKTSRAAAEIRGLEKDIISFNTEKARYPTVAEFLALSGVGDMKDPWGNNYVYAVAGTRTFILDINADFDLYSIGGDAETAASTIDPRSLDDIIRAKDGSFVGTAKVFGL